MTALTLVTRRMLLKDMGKAGLAVMVMGTACSSEEPASSTTSLAATTSSSEPAESTSSTAAGVSSSTAPSGDGGYEWQRANLGFVSAYVMYRSGEAIIVDTGVPGSEGAIESALSEVGLGWGDVGGLIVTHLHGDHQGSVPAVIAATGDDLPWFAGAADLDGIDSPTPGRAVGDGDVVGAGLEIIETPGHTDGHIAVLDPLAGILLTGDALNGTGSGVAGANPQFTTDMDMANASIAKLAGFDFEVALFGHGEPILSGASQAVGELAATLGG